jgi:hypothetical protein
LCLLLLFALLLQDPSLVPGYDGSLLGLSVDLTNRFLPAFDTPTGIPLSWVNLRHVREGPCLPVEGSRVSIWQPAMGVVISCGIALACPPARPPAGAMPASHSPPFFPRVQGQIPGDVRSTCTACAGTLLLEFGVLSRLTGNATYEALARHAVEAIYGMRSARGLVGNTLDCDSGEWVRTDAGVGAGVDSFYEYLLKVCVCVLKGRMRWQGACVCFCFFFWCVRWHQWRRWLCRCVL